MMVVSRTRVESLARETTRGKSARLQLRVNTRLAYSKSVKLPYGFYTGHLDRMT